MKFTEEEKKQMVASDLALYNQIAIRLPSVSDTTTNAYYQVDQTNLCQDKDVSEETKKAIRKLHTPICEENWDIVPDAYIQCATKISRILLVDPKREIKFVFGTVHTSLTESTHFVSFFTKHAESKNIDATSAEIATLQSEKDKTVVTDFLHEMFSGMK
jgi:hypothetical protein